MQLFFLERKIFLPVLGPDFVNFCLKTTLGQHMLQINQNITDSNAKTSTSSKSVLLQVGKKARKLEFFRE